MPEADPTSEKIQHPLAAPPSEPIPDTGPYKRQITSLMGRPVSDYLNDTQLEPLVRAYYDGKHKLFDTDPTFQLLGILAEPKSEALKPFYMHLLIHACTKSDGALSEMFGSYATNAAISNGRTLTSFIAQLETESQELAVSCLGKHMGWSLQWKVGEVEQFPTEHPNRLALRSALHCDSCDPVIGERLMLEADRALRSALELDD